MNESLFRIHRLAPAAVVYTLGGVLGLGAVILLFFPGGFTKLAYDMYASGIMETSAIYTWVVIHTVLTIVTVLSGCSMAMGLFWELHSKGDGFDILYHAARVQLWITRVTGATTLVYLIFRVVRYLLACPWMETGIYDAYVMLISESVMVAQAVGLYCLLQRFLNALCDALASMAYVRLSGKLDDQPIAGLCGTGFLVLAAVCLYLAIFRTLACLQAYVIDLVALLSAGMYGCVAVGNVLLGLYLLRYKKVTSELRFQMTRKA